MDDGEEEWRGHEDYKTREAAFQEAAEYNRKRIEGAENCSQIFDWAIVVESGEVVSTGLCTMKFADGNQVGWESLAFHRPVRIIHPTQEEIDRFGGDLMEWVADDAETETEAATA